MHVFEPLVLTLLTLLAMGCVGGAVILFKNASRWDIGDGVEFLSVLGGVFCIIGAVAASLITIGGAIHLAGAGSI